MIRIITDSASDFEPEEIARLGIICVPLSVRFGNAEYQENVNLSKQMFYQLLEQENEMPATSQPSPQAFLSVLQEAQDADDEAIVITLSSALSGTCQSAILAKNMLEYEDCYIVDSLTATAGERILVEQALKLRSAGRCAIEIAAELELLRSRITLYACMDTLKYLRKGGRLSETSYMIGSLARVKPILHVSEDGRAVIPAKVMGVRKGIRYLCDRLSVQEIDENYPLYIMYTHIRENGELLCRALAERNLRVPQDHLVGVGSVVGAHIGPNAFGIVYVEKKQEED